MNFLRFIMSEILWSSWIFFFPNICQIWGVFSSYFCEYFFSPSLFFLSRTLITWKARALLWSHRLLRASFHFFLLKSIFSLLFRLVTSIVLASNSSVLSFLLMSRITFFILLLYLWVLKFSLGSSLVVVEMIFFIISNMFIIACQSIFIMSVLKS